MPISWNEIRHNAIKFSREWKSATSESSDKQTFWNEFFAVFGIPRKTVASFEVPVLKSSGNFGKIDLLWKNKLLVEHKSAGEDLAKAKTQAFDYIQAMANEGRDKEIPRYVIVSDFEHIVLHDLEPELQNDLPLFRGNRVATTTFPLAEFHKHVHAFAFIPGYKQHKFEEQDPINIEAAEILGTLHDTLEAGGYTGHDLERFLVRILFCLFAEDTGIFEAESFRLFVENRTAPDGSDLGAQLAHLFDILNREKRQENLDEDLARFPYINGGLFNEHLGFASFNRDMRKALLDCCSKDWSRISPAIFGSLFQSIMQPKERRQIGAHYTSERDILKVIRSLFLDDLHEEFKKITGRAPDVASGLRPDHSAHRADPTPASPGGAKHRQLEKFHQKLGALKFLDPACGCGNFLVIAYRELRLLELEVLKELFKDQAALKLDLKGLCRVDVDQFYGIEIEEWPALIAEVAMWLVDHQLNNRVSETFGELFMRLPLKKSPAIKQGNALRLDWKTVLPPEQCSYLLGNPPFIGAKFQNDEQRADMDAIAGDVENHGLLDFVTGWYFKAADYIRGTRIVVGFVSTNSISQGEQAGTLWNYLFQHFGLKIHFAHRTFAWVSEARGKAHVHVIIVGFGEFDVTNKRIYNYETENATVTAAKNISPYLVEGTDLAITNSSKPICDVPEMGIGNKPIDGGNYLFTPEEKAVFLKQEPAAKEFFRRWIGAEEFINGIERWCLWLGDCPPDKLRKMPLALARVEAVRDFRLASKSAPTRKIAETPTRFHVEYFPKQEFLVIPEVSSERRKYIPIGFMSPRMLASNKLRILKDATLYHFGILSSEMHMAWVRLVTGRLKSDFQYSIKLVYNNFPWPSPTAEQRERVEEKAQAVLAAREPHLPPQGMSTLADLYDPLSMPPALAKAHAELDRAVEKCYRPEPFASDRHRVEYLFALYEKLTAPLLPAAPKTKDRASQSAVIPPKPRKAKTPYLPGQNIS